MKNIRLTVGMLMGTLMVFGGIQEECAKGKTEACYQSGITYGSIAYKLMQTICTEEPRRAEGGMSACACTKVRGVRFNAPESLAFETLFRGHFVDGAAEEIVAVTAGCEPHASNWGGALLFRKRGNRWHKVFYQAGYPGACKKIDAATGKSELLCLGEYMNQGYGSDRVIHYGVTDQGLRELETLYSGESDEGAMDPQGKNTLVESWEVKDVDRDGHTDAVLHVHDGEHRVHEVTYLYRRGLFVKRD